MPRALTRLGPPAGFGTLARHGSELRVVFGEVEISRRWVDIGAPAAVDVCLVLLFDDLDGLDGFLGRSDWRDCYGRPTWAVAVDLLPVSMSGRYEVPRVLVRRDGKPRQVLDVNGRVVWVVVLAGEAESVDDVLLRVTDAQSRVPVRA